MKMSASTFFILADYDFHICLQDLSEAGFSHIMWCHYWNTDFMFTAPEIREFKKTLRDCNLTLRDVHGSEGREKKWDSPEEYRRQAGVELVRNRLEMLTELEAEGVLVMHVPNHRFSHHAVPPELVEQRFEAVCRSLDDLMPFLEKNHLQIALENADWENWVLLKKFMDRYPPEQLGLCYDSGHAFLEKDHSSMLSELGDRLLSIHLSDNDGSFDHHLPPGYGNIDWENLCGLIARSSYQGPAAFEVGIWNSKYADKSMPPEHTPEIRKQFLTDMAERCRRVTRLLEQARQKLTPA